MKKFNLFKEIITVDKNALLCAINSSKNFAINIYGEIKESPFNSKEILIYQGKPEKVEKFESVLGKNYQLVEDKDRVLIKAFANWQELIGVNMPRASYDDTTADGVAEFSNKSLEDIGWHATEFNINYRTLVEVLEERCKGIIYCIEQEEPYQFSGLGFLSDDEEAKEVLFNYCQAKIKDMIENDPDFKRDELTDDEEEAAEFFNL
ncbi:MAG: hypothetical protein M0Q24_07010 [Sulfurimonas sp.]|uniref:hypothetical protein n=1 Tax=Sulfurimonas sp. TaxID=2022749 RepID=UPI0025F9EFE1|nr:hypothetical protein [Sulfurimonas sp.]MCK9491822.1 hypothetical protein [Sulfurimonas sp.]